MRNFCIVDSINDEKRVDRMEASFSNTLNLIKGKILKSSSFSESDRRYYNGIIKNIKNRSVNLNSIGTMQGIRYLYNKQNSTKQRKIADFILKMSEDELNSIQKNINSSNISNMIDATNQIDILAINRLRGGNNVKNHKVSVFFPEVSHSHIDSNYIVKREIASKGGEISWRL
nr:hypothetical protein [Liquorilactobacillus satsumensis]